MININVLDKDFNIVGVIDYYESFIWTDRFKSYGDFELYSGVDSKILDLCLQDYYLQINESDHMMIIDSIDITTNPETGNHIKITGKSLESLLKRRIIWDQTTVSGGRDHTLKTAIEVLFKLCFGFGPQGTEITKNEKIGGQTVKRIPYIRSTVALSNGRTQTIDVRKERVIRNLLYLKPVDTIMQYWDEEAEQYKDILIDKTQFIGDNLYDIITSIMDSYSNYGLGYRILPLYSMRKIYTDAYIQEHIGLTNEEWEEVVADDYAMVFEIYTGKNRSYEQIDNPYVVFSPDFDNIINTDYYDSLEGYKNVTLILGEGEGTDRVRLIMGGTDDQGAYIPSIERRELYTDARELQSSEYPSSNDYMTALKQKGMEKLYESTRQLVYDGEVEAERTFVYGLDFIMGDVIQIENEFGIAGKARVIEYIISEDQNGRSFYPTFDSVELISDYTENETDVEEES